MADELIELGRLGKVEKPGGHGRNRLALGQDESFGPRAGRVDFLFDDKDLDTLRSMSPEKLLTLMRGVIGGQEFVNPAGNSLSSVLIRMFEDVIFSAQNFVRGLTGRDDRIVIRAAPPLTETEEFSDLISGSQQLSGAITKALETPTWSDPRLLEEIAGAYIFASGNGIEYWDPVERNNKSFEPFMGTPAKIPRPSGLREAVKWIGDVQPLLRELLPEDASLGGVLLTAGAIAALLILVVIGAALGVSLGAVKIFSDTGVDQVRRQIEIEEKKRDDIENEIETIREELRLVPDHRVFVLEARESGELSEERAEAALAEIDAFELQRVERLGELGESLEKKAETIQEMEKILLPLLAAGGAAQRLQDALGELGTILLPIAIGGGVLILGGLLLAISLR